MPLTNKSPIYLHVFQNIALIVLCTCLIPLCTTIAILSHLISPYTKASKHIRHHRKWRAQSSATFRPRTILVTGVGMSKGLTLARTFYRAGHRVIGADFEPYQIPVCGHFSTSIEKFYRLSKPTQNGTEYIQQLKGIIEKENIELWVSVSGNASVLEDGEAAEII